MTPVWPSLFGVLGVSGCLSASSSASVVTSSWSWWALLAVWFLVMVVAALHQGPAVDRTWAVPMFDELQPGGRFPRLRVVVAGPMEVTAGAMVAPDELASWTRSSYPVVSICEVVEIDGNEVVTPRELRTLSGLQAARLLHRGWLEVGLFVVEVTRAWSRDVRPRRISRSAACSP